MRRYDRSALISGIIFIVLGVVFLLEQYGLFEVKASFVGPIVLVGIGVWLVAGRDRSRGSRPPPPPSDDPPPAAPQA